MSGEVRATALLGPGIKKGADQLASGNDREGTEWLTN